MGKSKKKNNEKFIYKEGLEKYTEMLREMIDILKEISVSEDSSGTIQNRPFFETVPTNSMEFRRRFTLKLIGWFEENIENIVNKIFENSRMSICKYENCTIILNEISTTISKFIQACLSASINKNSHDYTEVLFDLFKFILIANGDDAGVELVETFHEKRAFIPMAIKSKDYDDIIILNDIIKMAFALTTLSPEVDCTPSYNELESIEETDYPELVRVLGECVQYAKTYNPFYVRFMLSNPELRTKNKNVDKNYVIGLQALEFMKFVMNDKVISKFINKHLLTKDTNIASSCMELQDDLFQNFDDMEE